MMKANILQNGATYPRLTLFSEERYRGRKKTFRGNRGIRNLEATFDDAESLRFFSTNQNATLVLFSRRNFKGAFKVYRGNTNLRDLDNIFRDSDVESIVMANFHLTLAQIRRIRDNGLPRDFG